MKQLLSLVLFIGLVMLVKFVGDHWDVIVEILGWGFAGWVVCFSLYVILNKSGK